MRAGLRHLPPSPSAGPPTAPRPAMSGMSRISANRPFWPCSSPAGQRACPVHLAPRVKGATPPTCPPGSLGSVPSCLVLPTPERHGSAALRLRALSSNAVWPGPLQSHAAAIFQLWVAALDGPALSSQVTHSLAQLWDSPSPQVVHGSALGSPEFVARLWDSPVLRWTHLH